MKSHLVFLNMPSDEFEKSHFVVKADIGKSIDIDTCQERLEAEIA